MRRQAMLNILPLILLALPAVAEERWYEAVLASSDNRGEIYVGKADPAAAAGAPGFLRLAAAHKKIWQPDKNGRMSARLLNVATEGDNATGVVLIPLSNLKIVYELKADPTVAKVE